jgi:hypothetical protein
VYLRSFNFCFALVLCHIRAYNQILKYIYVMSKEQDSGVWARSSSSSNGKFQKRIPIEIPYCDSGCCHVPIAIDTVASPLRTFNIFPGKWPRKSFERLVKTLHSRILICSLSSNNEVGSCCLVSRLLKS